MPAVVSILALSAVFLAHAPPAWIRGAGAGAGAAVAAVAVRAAITLLGPSWATITSAARRARWLLYVLLGAGAAWLIGPYLVLIVLGCGVYELAVRGRMSGASHAGSPALLVPFAAAVGGFGALAWVAVKVGALSFGGGFVIVPLMQADAVHTYHWMSSTEFLNAVALGQVTPGPVLATVAAVGYAAHGINGGLLAAAIAFLPSLGLVLVLGPRFARLRANPRASAISSTGPDRPRSGRFSARRSRSLPRCARRGNTPYSRSRLSSCWSPVRELFLRW